MRSDHDTGNTGALRLSVVIPTYNCLSYLDECLRSVLRQLPDDCELIAVDDGSDDGTAQALAGYVDAHPRFRFVLCEHSGASGARNTGLDLARGAYVTFIDCDDCLREGFLACSLPMLSRGADLYIFGIERIPLSGIREYWTVQDRVYPDASAFADEYVRIRQLMIYSNCNKFYRRCIIEKLRLRFAEGIAFGEDRLFNYRYLTACGCVVTSSQIMLQYIQRSDQSMSSRHIPAYFSLARGLHEAKMDCILRLSGGTTETEKLEFIAYDVSREIEKTLDRFALHPEEKEENLPAIDRIIFGAPCEAERPIDVLVVLGSRNCGYKIRRALEIGMRNPGCFCGEQGEIHPAESGVFRGHHPRAAGRDARGPFRDRHSDRGVPYSKDKTAGGEYPGARRRGPAVVPGIRPRYPPGQLVRDAGGTGHRPAGAAQDDHAAGRRGLGGRPVISGKLYDASVKAEAAAQTAKGEHT